MSEELKPCPDTCAELGPLQEPENDDYFVIGLKKATKIVKAGGR